MKENEIGCFAMDFKHESIGKSLIVQCDCLEWFRGIPNRSIHAIVTDPPYGLKEYERSQIEKRKNGSGGIWRIPPAFDGHKRAPLPRFTALNPKERQDLSSFFREWARLAGAALRPGGHIFIASNAFISQLTFSALVDGGLEFRGEIVRLVRTLRGGDRPKNSELEFPNVSSAPRGCYEPWGIFRRPIPDGMTVAECLRKYQTGGLSRTQDDKPFADVIPSERTPRRERKIADHPSLKPQSFLRQLVHAALPLGKGIVVDPFMGSGSTVAAAIALNVECVGIEKDAEFFEISKNAIPILSAIELDGQYESPVNRFENLKLPL